jgi:hypothetical protein
MFEAITQITIYLAMVLLPVLIPAVFHVVYVARERQRSFRPSLAFRLPRVTAPRLAVPAAA